MKKVIINIIILIAIILIHPLNSFAYNTFTVSSEEGYIANAGDIIEMPIILSNISIEGIEKGIVGFTCNIDYNDEIFELLEDDEDFLKQNEDMKAYSNITYNKDEKLLLFNLTTGYFRNVADSMKKLVELGTIKVKVRDGIESGDYKISFTNISGLNNEVQIYGETKITNVKVLGDEDEQSNNEEEEEEKKEIVLIKTETLPSNLKGAKFVIRSNETGTIVSIIPDEINGAKIGKVLVNGTNIKRSADRYLFKSVPNEKYEIRLYGENNDLLYNTYYDVIVEYNNDDDDEKPGENDPEEEKPGESNPGEEKPGENDPEEEKPGENNPEEEKPGENNSEEEKPGENNPGEEKPGENNPGEEKPEENNPGEEKPGENISENDKPTIDDNKNDEKNPINENSPQTGDIVYTIIILLIIALYGVIIAYGIKYSCN